MKSRGRLGLPLLLSKFDVPDALVDRVRSLYLGHQHVVPLAVDNEVCGCTLEYRFDQVVIDVRLCSGLSELVERSNCRSTGHEPGFIVRVGEVGE